MVKTGAPPADRDRVTRRLLLPIAAALGLLWGAGAAAAASQPPAPAATVPAPPPAVPVTPATPAAPAVPATPTTPSVPATPATPATPASQAAWAAPAAKRLAAAGAWPELAGDDLSRDATRGDLDRALGAITGTRPASANPAAPATAWQSHLLVVRALGLEAERRGIARIAVDGGGVLRMPRFAGSEVLARELGLVYNQPASQDGRERAKGQPLRLADLAYMADRARGVSSWQRAGLARYRDIRLPAMSAQRLAVVQAAVSQVGQPYVWAGDWPGVRSPWGVQAHGGFDCSGLVWWAFKGSAGPSQMSLGSGLLGRTADAMAWERPAEREAADAALPGDLVFFGPKGPTSPRGSISHTGIALGGGWMIHSSGSRGGVSISWLPTYWPSATAWARRVAQLGA